MIDLKVVGPLIAQLQGALGGKSQRSGTVTVTWAGALQNSGAATVTHGLGKVPTEVQLTGSNLSAGGAYAVPVPSALGLTTFVVIAKTHDLSVPGAGVTATVYWTASG